MTDQEIKEQINLSKFISDIIPKWFQDLRLLNNLETIEQRQMLYKYLTNMVNIREALKFAKQKFSFDLLNHLKHQYCIQDYKLLIPTLDKLIFLCANYGKEEEFKEIVKELEGKKEKQYNRFFEIVHSTAIAHTGCDEKDSAFINALGTLTMMDQAKSRQDLWMPEYISWDFKEEVKNRVQSCELHKAKIYSGYYVGVLRFLQYEYELNHRQANA